MFLAYHFLSDRPSQVLFFLNIFPRFIIITFTAQHPDSCEPKLCPLVKLGSPLSCHLHLPPTEGG